MVNGRTFAKKLDESQAELSAELRARTADTDALTRALNRARRDISDALREIARVQAEAIGHDEIRAHDELAQHAEEVSRRREQVGQELRSQLARLEGELSEAHRREQAAAAALAVATTARDDLQSRVDQSLPEVQGFIALNGDLKVATERTRAARTKARAATEEMNAKVGAYEADPLFRYLIQRPASGVNALVRTIDGWVSRLCGFERASRDYAALHQLPTYLAAHAEAMEQEEARIRAEIGAMRMTALDAAGFQAVNQERGAREKDHATAAAAVSKLQDAVQNTHDALNKLANWRDQEGAALLEKMSALFSAASLDELEERVARTVSREDDQQLSRIRKLRSEIAGVEAELADLEPVVKALDERAKALTLVKKKYKSKGYDSGDYTFSGIRLSELLQGYVMGNVVSGDLWRSIDRAASYDPPRPSYSSSHSSSRSDSGSSTGGGFGGGGFSTGGGFGGGGFSTGGGF
jgi:chromosome segregation ATPase